MPQGGIDGPESPENAMKRELMEETGIKGYNPQIITVKGNPDRDPRKHIVSIFYHVDVDSNSMPKAGDDAAHAEWISVNTVMKEGMAGDHWDVLENL